MNELQGDYYDRSGRRLSGLAEWGVLHACREYVIVQKTTLDSGVEISTVWLGINHAFGQGDPIIFETMIFGGPLNEQMWRYRTEAEAIAGHWQAVADAKAAEEPVDSLLEKREDT